MYVYFAKSPNLVVATRNKKKQGGFDQNAPKSENFMIFCKNRKKIDLNLAGNQLTLRKDFRVKYIWPKTLYFCIFGLEKIHHVFF